MKQDEGNTARVPRALAAELVIGEMMLALSLQELLGGFNFVSFQLPAFLVLLGLLVLIVWVAQLLVSWSVQYQTLSDRAMPLRGMIQLWTYVPYTGLVYLACKYQGEYPWPLLFITLILILDIISSGLDVRFSRNKDIREVNRNWLVRDMFLVPMVVIAWVVHFLVDQSGTLAPSIWSGLLFLAGMITAYIFDLIKNRKFYGLSARLPMRMHSHS